MGNEALRLATVTVGVAPTSTRGHVADPRRADPTRPATGIGIERPRTHPLEVRLALSGVTGSVDTGVPGGPAPAVVAAEGTADRMSTLSTRPSRPGSELDG